jgi:small subunit ribosomal protein S3
LGQKSHPYGLRLGYIKPWKAKWYSRHNEAGLLKEDLEIRRHVKKTLGFAGVSNIEIERSAKRIRVRIYTARPGVIIGRRGQEIDKVKDTLAKLTNCELFIDIKEIKIPQIDAQLVAENVAMQLERRVSFRRAMKKTLQMARMKGAKGIKIACKGRLGGADIAREEKYHEGKIPLSTFRADIDYGFAESHTTYGVIGCKVWIYKGDILVKKEQAAERVEREKQQAEKWRKEASEENKEEASPKSGKKSKGKTKLEAAEGSTDSTSSVDEGK